MDPGNIVSIKFLGFLEFLGVIRVLRQKKVRKTSFFVDFSSFLVDVRRFLGWRWVCTPFISEILEFTRFLGIFGDVLRLTAKL